jgi:dTDP-4-dehydrorhamnose 3,5-epimerase-like enzyme
MLLIAKGFGHGYFTLVDDTEVSYQVTAATVAIRWPFAPSLLSEGTAAYRISSRCGKD